MLMMMTPKARRQRSGFEEGLLISGLQICATPITLSLSLSLNLSLSLSLSTGAKTFDTNLQKGAWELRHSMGSASASEMSTISETFDDFWTKVLPNPGFLEGSESGSIVLVQ